MVAVLTTPVISITGVQTALEAGNRDQVVSGNTPTPAIKVLAIKEYITKIIFFFQYLPGLMCMIGIEMQVGTMAKVSTGMIEICRNIVSIYFLRLDVLF